ncbi:MAG: nitrate transporter substrate-binding protein [Devosia sp.]|jgi:NitT/TauT family transport system substrate-binding protein|nr:nitrate transporter substrate-binding protein [Devosia sp.]
MNKFIGMAAGIAVIALTSTAVQSQEAVAIVLNWTPGADHAPIYYAKQQGWYDEAGINLTIDAGSGSAMSAQSVGVGKHAIGIAELGTAFVARSMGADVVAVMSLYAQAPFAFYWKKSSGIETVADFAGHTIGNPPADAARVMWPAFAEAAGLAVDSVTFVNITPQAKVASLAAGQVDIISDFYNGHDLKVETFGDDLKFVRWSELGLNPYGNSFIVNGDFLENHRDTVAAFVKVTQRAYSECVANVDPCIDALTQSASGLERGEMNKHWGRVKELMADEFTTTKGLGYLDADRVAQTYKLVETYFDIQTPFDPADAFTSEFLDTNLKMAAQ